MKKFNLFILFSLFCLVEGCSAGKSAQSLQNANGQPAQGSNQVNLNWTSNLGEQQGFYVEESSDGVNFSQVLTVPDGPNSATIALPSAGKYYFRVRGYNQAGNSPYTAVVTTI